MRMVRQRNLHNISGSLSWVMERIELDGLFTRNVYSPLFSEIIFQCKFRLDTRNVRNRTSFLEFFEPRQIPSERVANRTTFLSSRYEKYIDLPILIEYMYPEIRRDRGSLGGSIRVRQPGKSFKAERSRWFHFHADLFTFCSRPRTSFSIPYGRASSGSSPWIKRSSFQPVWIFLRKRI